MSDDKDDKKDKKDKNPSSKQPTANNTWMFVAAGAVVVGIAVYFLTRPSSDDDPGSVGGFKPGSDVNDNLECGVNEQLRLDKAVFEKDKVEFQRQYNEIVKEIGKIETEHTTVKEEIGDTEAILEDRLDDLSKSKKNLIGVSTGFGIFGTIVIALVGIKIVNTVRRRKKSG